MEKAVYVKRACKIAWDFHTYTAHARTLSLSSNTLLGCLRTIQVKRVAIGEVIAVCLPCLLLAAVP